MDGGSAFILFLETIGDKRCIVDGMVPSITLKPILDDQGIKPNLFYQSFHSELSG